jgi:dihydroxyacid dehydratase/phosphogluconate dehydratase
MRVVKDGGHFKICNREVLPSFTDSLVIDLKYEVIPACDKGYPTCLMAFTFTDWVEITEIE